MKRFTRRIGIFLSIDLLLLVICLLHIPSVLHRPSAPFEVTDVNERIIVSAVTDRSAAGVILPGDRLISWNGLKVPAPEAVEFLGDQGTIGATVPVTVERGGNVLDASVTLIPFYSSPRFLTISVVVGLIIWGMAILILWSAPSGFTAMVLHWTMIAFAVTILITPGSVSSSSVMSSIDRGLFFLAYQGVVALFFYFTLLYPTQRLRPLPASVTLLPALSLIAGMTWLHLADLAAGSLEYFAAYQTLFDLFHISLFAYTGGAVFNIAASLRKADREDQRKLQWIVWGLCVGAAPFLFLHVLPQVLFSRYFMAEEYATIFFLAIPFSFTMSFLKYHFLDIEVLMSRSIVYTVLSLFVVITFSLTFFLITSAFGTRMLFEEYLALSAVALLFALLFGPVRNRVQHTVDETLFAARANFRAAVRDLSSTLHHVLTSDALFRSLVDRLYGLIPVRTMGVYRLTNGDLRLAHRRGDMIPEHVMVSDEERFALARASLTALPGTVEGRGITDRGPARTWLERTGCSVSVSLTNNQGDLVGSVVLSPKTERDRFRVEEIDLLQTGCAQASEILERLILQERMILEQEENRRLSELSDLKSYFVSSVSHELRTPLTSIRMFAETLRMGRYTGRRQQNAYLKIIEGESRRLGRLIGNVLDYSKIERGVKEYEFAPVNPRAVVKDSVRALKYEFQAARGILTVSVAKSVPRRIVADADALEQLLINLLSNALKYSIGKKHAQLSVRRSGKHVVIRVSDRGIGIPPKELPMIFDKFHRVRDSRPRQVGGTGLGLAIVKHIVEAHHGTISVQSTVGKGSTFTVKIPIDFKGRQD